MKIMIIDKIEAAEVLVTVLGAGNYGVAEKIVNAYPDEDKISDLLSENGILLSGDEVGGLFETLMLRDEEVER